MLKAGQIPALTIKHEKNNRYLIPTQSLEAAIRKTQQVGARALKIRTNQDQQ